MKRKIELGMLAVLALAGLTFIIVSAARRGSEDVPAGPAKPETTIRNVTNEAVHYRIKSYDSAERPQARKLPAGAIDRYPGSESLVVTFLKGGRTEENVLGAGLPYSFRYDENGEIQIYQGAHGRADAADLAPYVGTPMPIVEKMLEMAGVGPRDVVYDIGCGDGRIVIAAAQQYGARGVGIDIDPRRIAESRAAAKAAGVDKLVKFRREDATKSDISAATVVTLYLLPESNELLRPIFEAQLKPGARVVSHNYDIAGWKTKEIDAATVKGPAGEDHTIFLYRR